MKAPNLAIILPCYNEEEVLPHTIPVMTKLLAGMIAENLIASNSKLVFVDDGSTDKTYEILHTAATKNKHIAVVKLSRNFGQQEAILAGLFSLDADVYVTIDSDLQDPPETIGEMLSNYRSGNEVVYAARESRKTDFLLKRWTALLFYRIMRAFGTKTIYNHCNFRLMSRRVIQELKNFPERNFFIRGMIPLIGFKSSIIYYDRMRRVAGKTKWSSLKLCSLAMDAITGFSNIPLRFITLFGLFVSLVSFCIVTWTFYTYFTGINVKGWTSIVFVISFFSGIILFSLGIIGEYIGRILIEVKHRPLYIIEKTENL